MSASVRNAPSRHDLIVEIGRGYLAIRNAMGTAELRRASALLEAAKVRAYREFGLDYIAPGTAVRAALNEEGKTS